jgi:hypothetical protein
MGMNRRDLELLIELRKQQYIPLNRYVVELGAQQVSNSFLRSTDLVQRAEALFGTARSYAQPEPGPSMVAAGHVELLNSDAPFARDFWTALGFDYSAIDVDGSPGSIPLDLNYDHVPSALQNKYGLVTNFGTTEHICNQMNAFKVIHDLAAPSAVMIHHLPAGGALNHGLINYNLKFFWYLARSNDYKWLYRCFYDSIDHYSIPENILEFNDSDAPELNERLRPREIGDYAVLIAFQKTTDIAFIAPIDVDTGTQTSDAALNRRYWTVFQPGILDTVRSSDNPRQTVSKLTAVDAPASDDEVVPEAVERTVFASEERMRTLVDNRSAEMRDALQRIPSRGFIAFVAGVAALSAAIGIALILVVARLLWF